MSVLIEIFFFCYHPNTFLHRFLNDPFICAERLLVLPFVASRGHPKSGPTALAAGLKNCNSCYISKNPGS